MKCSNCGKNIPKARIKALPNTKTCTNCSTEQPKQGIVVWDKTTPILGIVSKKEAEEFKHFENGDGRFSRL